MMCSPKSYCNSCDSFIGLVSSFFWNLLWCIDNLIRWKVGYGIDILFTYIIIIGFCQGNFSLRSLSNHFRTWIVTFCSQNSLEFMSIFVCKHFQCQLCEIISSYCLFVQQFCIVKNLSKLLWKNFKFK